MSGFIGIMAILFGACLILVLEKINDTLRDIRDDMNRREQQEAERRQS